MECSRSNPSQRFKELLQFYQDLYQQGDQLENISKEDNFDGRGLQPHVQTVKQVVKEFQLKTLLDYGCGKATFHDRAELDAPGGKTLRGLKEIWGVDKITLYDPGYAPYSELPSETFDGVICTNVLEHCPEEDIDWIIDELFAFANRYLFFSITCYREKNSLPTEGGSPHITLKRPGWWIDKLYDAATKRSEVDFYLWIGIAPNKDPLIVKSHLTGV